MNSPYSIPDLLARIPRCTCGCLVNLHTVTAGPNKQRGVCQHCGRDQCPQYQPVETPTFEAKESTTC